MVRLGQAAQDGILRVVGILVLVHEDVAEATRNRCAGIGVVLQQDVHIEQDVVEIHRAGRQAFLLVELIDVGGAGMARDAVALCRVGIVAVGGDRHQAVFRHRDDALDGIGLVGLVVELELPDALLDDAAGIGLVVDREILRIAEPLGVLPQEADENGMKGAHLDPAGLALAHQRGHALLHLIGSFLGEGQGQHLARPAFPLQNMRDAARQHARLPGTGPRNDERRALRTKNSLFLSAVQPLEQVCL